MASHAVYEWEGREWQDYCEQLLIRRYPNSYARMPDTDRGDLGLEGYSTDGSACAYQCYAPEARDTGKRAEAQQGKITRDLKKLKDRATEVERHLRGITLRHWVLLTPLHDSKAVTAHARAKELEMRGVGLSFLHSEFRIDIQTVETHFTAERRRLEEEGLGVIAAPPASVDAAELERLAREGPLLLSNLEAKVRRLMPAGSKEKWDELRDTFQRYAVDGANLEDHLRINHAPTYERYLRERDAEERAVHLECLTGEGGSAYVSQVRARYEARLRREVSAMRQGDEADRLSYSAVADWLRRCPMDFAGPP